MKTLFLGLAIGFSMMAAPTLGQADSPPPAPAMAAPAAAQAPATKEGPSSFTTKPPIGTKATCPVSGEHFIVKKKTPMETYKGRVYAFCCPDCRGDFKKNPEKFASKK